MDVHLKGIFGLVFGIKSNNAVLSQNYSTFKLLCNII